MTRPQLEVADIFRRFGPAWRAANAGHLSLAQRRVMRAVELCRTAELGGHVEQCADCAHTRIAYNSCRNRHCPKCQWTAAQAWLEAREAELLPVPYFHVVFTLPAALGALAYQNKARVYGLLLKTAAETLTTIAADPKHLGARIGVIAVLHSWGQTLDHHPHVHCIVPAGGISLDGSRWIACRPGFFLPVRVLSRLFRRLFLEGLARGHRRGELRLFGDLAGLAEPGAFKAYLAAQRRREWVVYAKAPFAGPKQVLAYLARYTHRVAIANSRLVALDDDGQVSFRWKDYRDERPHKPKVMRLPPASSCAASCSTCCPTGSTASATTACSPTATGRRCSPAAAACSPSPRRTSARGGRGADTASRADGAGTAIADPRPLSLLRQPEHPALGAPPRAALSNPEAPMRVGPANAVHAVAAPEITARVTQPVCAVPAPMSIRPLTASRGGLPNPSRSIADGPDRAPAPRRANLAEAIDGPGLLRHQRREPLHP